MSQVAGTGVGVLGGQVCRMRGAFPLHAQHRALRGPPRGFGIMRMCSSYLVSNHSYNLTCSQGETDAPRSRSSQGAWTRGPTPAGCFQRTTGAQLSVYWQHGRCVHRLAQTRARKDSALSGAFAVLHVVVTCVLSVSVTVVMSRPGQQMTQSQALDGRGTTPRSNARLHLLVRRACAHVVSRTCCW